MTVMPKITERVRIAAGSMLLCLATVSAASDFSKVPLFVGAPVEPNLLFVLDDSGSMLFEHMPDGIEQTSRTNRYTIPETCSGWGWNRCTRDGVNAASRWYYSSHVNKLYYDPDVTYRPPYCGTGSNRCSNDRYPASSYSSAWVNGYAGGTTRNLTSNFVHRPFGAWTGSSASVTVTEGGFYYRYAPSDANRASCEANPEQNFCYEYVSLNNETDQQTNFANWYSYYRTREYAARAGIGEAFKELPEDFRLGWGAINQGRHTVDGANVHAVVQGVRPYLSTHKQDFYTWLYGNSASGGTPLRRALEGAGRYFQLSDAAWRTNPTSSSSPMLECRQSATILMTDGYGTDYGSNLSVDVGDADSNNGALITNDAGDRYQYRAGYPFSDNRSGTLADIAMYYWKRDLRTVIDNYVPTTDRNPAFWQHMVTYGVGLGVSGSVDPDDAWAAFEERNMSAAERETSISWPNPTGSEAAKLDDLLHAALNSRGGFFSAADPVTFATELSRMIDEFVAQAGSATGVSFDMATVESGETPWAFTASFDPNSWSGNVVARPVETTGGLVIGAPSERTAASRLNQESLLPDDREIISFDGARGRPFRVGQLSDSQKDDLEKAGAVADVVDYLRGDDSNEAPSGDFRARSSRLGDIVHSTPAFIGRPNSNWPDSSIYGADNKRYSSFLANNSGRTPVLYAGSNDGMLHAFNASEVVAGSSRAIDFTELFAYVPGFLFSDIEGEGLHYLADTDYSHKFYVDLPLRSLDVFVKGRTSEGGVTSEADWRTILIGGARTGGKGIFALDVTDPDIFEEGSASQLVLWEFTHNNLGYLTDAPIIALAEWGNNDIRWTAFFGNGFGENKTGLYMLDIEGLIGNNPSFSGGSVNAKFIEMSPTSGGMSAVAVLDTDGDGIADRVYGGDQQGNMWAIEAGNNGSWASAYRQSGNPQPLFTAKVGDKPQPITAAPRVTRNPVMPRAGNEPNLLVVFGTGSYLYTNDPGNNDTQSVYGVWDSGSFGLDRDNLQLRTMQTTQVDGVNARLSEGDAIDYASSSGWYVDLPVTFERVVTGAQIRGGFVFINSMIPDVNPCSPGGNGWLMAFGLDGLTPENRVFLDLSQSVVGYQVTGIPSDSSYITIDGKVYRVTALSGGGIDSTEVNPGTGTLSGLGRRGWQEVFE